jgi:small subunit ribosomal protein S3
MGQKVSPVGLRLGINRTWDSRWYAGKDYAKTLYQDVKLRDMLTKKLKLAGISRIIIERAAKKMVVTLHAGRPGLIIGKKGADIEKLRGEIAAFTGSEVALNIIEIRKPEVDGKLVAEGVTSQLERRVSFRRAMKRATQSHFVWAHKAFVSTCRAALAVRTSPVWNGTAKAACLCTRCAPISTMRPLKR